MGNILDDNAVICETCGHLSVWAGIRVSNGETAVCFDCLKGEGPSPETKQTEVPCTCDFSRGNWGCNCNYSKSKRGRK